MKINFVPNINAYGESLIRLYNSNKAETAMLRDLIKEFIIKQKQSLDLNGVGFIELINCNLIFRISNEDEGVFRMNRVVFVCDLTLKTYNKMVELLEPFCVKETKSYQMLYDLDNPIDIMFAPSVE